MNFFIDIRHKLVKNRLQNYDKIVILSLFCDEMIILLQIYDGFCGVHTLRDPSGYPSGGSPLVGTVTPGPNWPFLSPP